MKTNNSYKFLPEIKKSSVYSSKVKNWRNQYVQGKTDIVESANQKMLKSLTAAKISGRTKLSPYKDSYQKL